MSSDVHQKLPLMVVAKCADAEDISSAAPLPQERPHPAADAHADWLVGLTGRSQISGNSAAE